MLAAGVAILAVGGSGQRLSGQHVLGAVAGRPAVPAVRSVAEPAAFSPSGKTLATAPVALQAAVLATVGGDSSRFAVRRRGGSLTASGGVSSDFDHSGPTVHTASGDLHLSLAGIGYGSRLSKPGTGSPAPAANAVAYRRGSVTEWYRNRPDGLEQGFTILRRPEAGSGRLTIGVRASGPLRPTLHGSEIVFTAGDATVLRYGGLSAVDATGRSLPARLELHDATLLLRVDDAGARYPLTVDPLIQRGSKLTENLASSSFGASVALSTDGNTALIGGYLDNGNVGAARVFTRTAGVWAQQGPKLTAGDEVGAGQFGQSVALSADGDTALIGGFGDNGNVGAAWVFTRSAGVWTQQGAKLTGSDETGTGFFGVGVALSADGDTALIGGSEDSGGVGAAWVFSRTAGVWTQQGAKLNGSGETGTFVLFGASIAVSADGNTALVGGPFDNGQVGAAWVFTRSNGIWTQQGAKLTGGGETGAGRFGNKVALSADGNTALIGGETDTSGVGASWVFTRTAGVWAQQGSKLTAGDEVGAGQFGQGVALSADGNTAVIGGNDDNGSVGAAWAFTRTAGVWAQQGTKVTGTGEVGPGKFGQSVALSADGDTALIGGYVDNGNAGAAWAFTRSGGEWTQQGSKLTDGAEIGAGGLGWSVALSSDGSTALVGARTDDGSVGAAWVFIRSGDVWTRQGSKLTGSDESGAGEFGISVALSADGNTAMVGGWEDAGPLGSGLGAAWVFTRSSGTWTQAGPKLTVSDFGGTYPFFGCSVALSADASTALIGGCADNGFVGSAWVFTQSGGIWTQQGPKLTGSGEIGGGLFGESVALSADGNTALVGAGQDNGNVGGVWVFTRSAGVWTPESAKLTGAGESGSGLFGESVSLSADGDTAMIGGPGDASGAGGAWVFTRSLGVWTPQGGKLTPSPGTGDFGASVSLSADGNTALIGGDGDGGGAGAAWVFTRSAGAWTQQGSKLTGSDTTAGAAFGFSASLSADARTALIGGHADNSDVGAAWVFSLSPVPVDCVEDPSTALQDAIAAAYDGDTLEISGTCTGAFVIPPRFSGGLTLRGATPTATLDGQFDGTSVLTVAAGADATVDSLTITRGGSGDPGPGSCSEQDGEGINNAGTLVLRDGTVTNNIVGNCGVKGGGIFNTGELTITGSTVSDNFTGYVGGGIENSFGATMTVTNSTVAGNGAGLYSGMSNDGTLTLNYATVSGNTLLGSHGGIFANDLGSTTTLTGTIVSGNGGDDCAGGAFTSGGYNLIGNADNPTVPTWVGCHGTSFTSDPTNQLGTSASPIDPMLGALGDNGGSTATMLPGPDSPVLDRIPSGTAGCGTTVTSDQRGEPRPQAPGGRCGLGAVESGGGSNDAWTRARLIAVDDTGQGGASGSLNLSGQARWYKVAVAPGGSVDVDLTNLPANYDLALFGDIGQAESSLNSPSGLQTLAAQTPGDAFSPAIFSPAIFSPAIFSPAIFSPAIFSPAIFSPAIFSPAIFSPAIFSPAIFSPAIFSPAIFSPAIFSPAIFSPSAQDYEAAQVQSLLAVSGNDGAADEHVFQDVWNNTGYFYIRVNGRNGAYAPGAPFSLKVHVDAGTCTGVVPSNEPLLSASYAGPGSPGYTGPPIDTLILTDTGRMTGQLSPMTSDLATFAGLPSVNGAIVDVGTVSPRVASLEQQGDAHRDCPYAKNLAANAIRDVVGLVRAQNSGLKYVVLVGDDQVIPFFRYPDTAGLGPETGYEPPVIDSSASQASLKTNEFLSQDAYGSDSVIDVKGLELPIPDLPVGRLVETPDEIDGMLQAYLGLHGGVVPTPTSSLATGYDFMAPEADAIETDLSAGLGAGATNDTLITKNGVAATDTGAPPSHSWTADQLRTALLGKRHDLIFLGGHFSANNAEAADFATYLDSTELAASNVNLENAIVFSQGCHSGYNIVDQDAVPRVTQPVDWAEAFAMKRATLIAGTGYQYGDTDFLAYSGKLYAGFAHALRLGSGPVAVGGALVEAKASYLESVTNLKGVDLKSLLEPTLYGLPMTSVDLPAAGRLNPPAGSSVVAPTPFTTEPGKMLGLSSANVTLSTANGYKTPDQPPATLTTNTKQLFTPTGVPSLSATWLSGPDGVVTSPGAPTLPLAASDVTDVSGAGAVLRGVGFWSGTYSDQSGITPLTGSPATELNGVHSTFAPSTFFPGRLWTVNYFGGLVDGSTSARLSLTPAQYKDDGTGLTDVQRTYTSVGLRLFYSANRQTYGANTPALADSPTIARVDATATGGTVAFEAHVVGDPAAGIQQVWVTYTGVDPGQWESLELTQDGADSTLWSATLTGLTPTQIDALQFVVQAVNGVGEVSLDDNIGSYYRPGRIAPALESSREAATVQLAALPVSGDGGSPITVSATVTDPQGAVVDEPVTFAIGGATAAGRTNASGLAQATLTPVDLPGSQYQLTATFGGTGTLAGASDSRAFTIDKRPTTLTPSAHPAAAADTGIGATLSSGGVALVGYPVAFVLTPVNGGAAVVQDRTTDLTGRASLGTVDQLLAAQLPAGSYSVVAFFGFVHPVSAPESRDHDPVYASSESTSVPLTVTYKAPAITSASNATFVVGAPSSFTVATTGLPANAIDNASFAGCTSSALPATLTFIDNGDDTARLAGTPTATGTFTLCLNATNPAGTAATQRFTLTVGQPPAITSPSSAALTAGTAGTFTVTTTGFPTNTITNADFAGCTKSALPTGVGFTPNGNTATLAGTPAAGTAGTYTLCLKAANGVGSAANQKLTLTVATGAKPLGPGTTSCNGTFGGRGADVVVPAGAVCTLVPGTQVAGDVAVQKGGSLNAQGVSIGGDLTASNAVWVKLGGGGTIRGDLQVRGLTGSPAGSHDTLCNTKVGGDVRVQDGRSGAAVDIGSVGDCSGGAGLTVGGDLQLTTTAGNVAVGGNTVKGDLTIANNTGKLTVSGNAAQDIQVHDNTVGVGSTLTNNAAAGDCKLERDNPKITGTGNTVRAQHTNTCNRIA